MKTYQPTLKFCLLMDLAGCITYIIPGFGELGDVLWAPISAITFVFTFGRAGLVGGMFNFVEEILPGTDFIPTYTIMWLINYYRKVKVEKELKFAH
ncbi:MAG: hypothetical protein ABIU77_24810 [Ferruginibacter sp.]